MFIYMSLNSYILAYIRRIPTISTNGSKRMVGGSYANAKGKVMPTQAIL
jgi:hypothetical protein